MQKTCAICREEKDLERFDRHPNTKDGRDGRCKDCVKQLKMDYYHHKGGKQKKLLYYFNKKRDSSLLDGKTILTRDPKNSDIDQKEIGIRKSFSISDKDVLSIKQYGERYGSKSFGDAFKSMLETSLEKTRYFRKAGFDNACVVLSKNYEQVRRVLVNLEQLSRLYSTGRTEDFLSNSDDLTDLLALCFKLKVDIDNKISLIQHHSPENR